DSVDSKRASTGNEYEDKAAYYLDGLGGKENIKDVTNCTTRLRLTVYDESKVADTEYFTHQQMAHGLVKSGKSIQVVVGMTVPQVREAFEQMVEDQSSEDK
ncbi:PTS transporter subunit EIIB, partial [Staphylococcus aureus]|nr:PTS transporter subunit EIIB [Staphylococcus aureus]